MMINAVSLNGRGFTKIKFSRLLFGGGYMQILELLNRDIGGISILQVAPLRFSSQSFSSGCRASASLKLHDRMLP